MTYHIPTPGSVGALSRGCKCPVFDNHYGAGAYVNERGEPQFWISGDCALHATPSAPTPKDPATIDLFGDATC